MDKKITNSADADLVTEEVATLTTFAEMANGTVVIGNKAFDLAYANDPANIEEISKAVASGGIVYVKDFDGNWIDNITGKNVDASIIPAVVYKSVDMEINFDAGDKNQNQVSK